MGYPGVVRLGDRGTFAMALTGTFVFSPSMGNVRYLRSREQVHLILVGTGFLILASYAGGEKIVSRRQYR